MRQPIILWQSERALSTDDAGVTILSSVSPPKTYFQPGPYYDEDVVVVGPAGGRRLGPLLTHVPPLSYFCIKHLVKTPELVYNYGPARPYRSPEFHGDPDILQAVIPRTPQGNVNLSEVDPRLWAVIVQVYSDLPSDLRIYRTALADKYIPSLQRIPTTEHFSLLTVLELPGCSYINDDTIIRLTVLHTLCVLDASNTPLSAQGIRRLSGTLRWGDDGVDVANQRRGPWQLRILSLRNCKQVTDNIYQYLESFILLAVVDLRGTRCTWDREKVPSTFFPANEKQLYHPTTPLEALSLLTSSPCLLPSSNTALLHIDHLTHPTPEHQRDYMARENVGPQCEVNPFYAQRPSNTDPLKAHSHRQMPQWGQELLMLYREPPPWSTVQAPPIATQTRSPKDLVAIKRTDKQAMKSLQKMQDMLSERHRTARTETKDAYDGSKESAKLFAPRNPFAIPNSGGPSERVSERAHGRSCSFSPHTHAVAKSTMEVPPKSWRSLRPITSLPVPQPPDSATPAPANKGRGLPPRPQLSHESSQKRVSVSPQTNKSDQKEMMVASAAIRRERASVGRKRPRTAAP